MHFNNKTEKRVISSIEGEIVYGQKNVRKNQTNVRIP